MAPVVLEVSALKRLPDAEYITLLSGNKMPSVGFGTWRFGSDVGKAVFTAIVQAGYRHVDTASEYGIQEEDFLSGVGTDDIGDLSPTQLRLVDELQRRTIRAEDELHLEMSRFHEELATQFVESGLASASTSDLDSASASTGFGNAAGRIKEIIARADNLRMTTLREALDVLYRPVHAIDLLLAAADFEIRIRNFGLKHDMD